MPNYLFRWEDSNGTAHHCCVCKRPLSVPENKRRCIGGLHVIPCPKFHQNLFKPYAVGQCKPCRNSLEAHRARHRCIAEALFELENVWLKNGIPVPRRGRSQAPETFIAQIDQDIANSQKDKRKAKKLAKELKRASKRPDRLTTKDIDWVENVMHPEQKDDPVLAFFALLDDPNVEKNVAWVPAHGDASHRAVLKDFQVERRMPDFGAEVKRVIFEFGINTKKEGQDKEVRELVATIRSLAREDFEQLWKEEQQTLMRRDGFLRWISKTIYKELVAERQDRLPKAQLTHEAQQMADHDVWQRDERQGGDGEVQQDPQEEEQGAALEDFAVSEDPYPAELVDHSEKGDVSDDTHDSGHGSSLEKESSIEDESLESSVEEILEPEGLETTPEKVADTDDVVPNDIHQDNAEHVEKPTKQKSSKVNSESVECEAQDGSLDDTTSEPFTKAFLRKFNAALEKCEKAAKSDNGSKRNLLIGSKQNSLTFTDIVNKIDNLDNLDIWVPLEKDHASSARNCPTHHPPQCPSLSNTVDAWKAFEEHMRDHPLNRPSEDVKHPMPGHILKYYPSLQENDAPCPCCSHWRTVEPLPDEWVHVYTPRGEQWRSSKIMRRADAEEALASEGGFPGTLPGHIPMMMDASVGDFLAWGVGYPTEQLLSHTDSIVGHIGEQVLQCYLFGRINKRQLDIRDGLRALKAQRALIPFEETVLRRLESSVVSSVDRVCYCRGLRTKSMIRCAYKGCKFTDYHLRCVGLAHNDGPFYCWRCLNAIHVDAVVATLLPLCNGDEELITCLRVICRNISVDEGWTTLNLWVSPQCDPETSIDPAARHPMKLLAMARASMEIVKKKWATDANKSPRIPLPHEVNDNPFFKLQGFSSPGGSFEIAGELITRRIQVMTGRNLSASEARIVTEAQTSYIQRRHTRLSSSSSADTSKQQKTPDYLWDIQQPLQPRRKLHKPDPAAAALALVNMGLA